ncbi:hypothetical protein [Actinomadura sp. 3N508]|uniref:hypothetical protein n=1 Tax=Actinomadura sp. 3N508 TaxID=3375153 RepID=UPI00379D46D0
MTGRALIWIGGLTAVASAAVLAVYFAVEGFRRADVIGTIGAVVGITGLALAVYGMATSRRTSGRTAGVQMKAKASGRGRVYQAGRDQHIGEDR